MVIYKMHCDHTIDFAAEELKKYLRMMTPDIGDIAIESKADAADGFRLGLLSDFGIPFEGKDPKLDDIVHIEADAEGGILAGSNPRSVLFAVYRLLKLNGCRFFFSGPEGEYIPMQPLAPTSYHKLADHRLRGHTIEGCPSMEEVLHYIDFHAKEELNTFGLYGIDIYHRRNYAHWHNEANRPAEAYDGDLAETQWRALYESELKKRGMLICSGEHDIVPLAMGFDLAARHLYISGEKTIDEASLPYLAMHDGKRGLYETNDILWSQLCYSNPKVRTLLAEQAVKMVRERPSLDYFGVVFADGSKNHCECEECQKKRPSDWYIMLLNEIDAKFTENNISTKILFSFYVDTMFAPTTEKLNDPDRFLFQFCPIARSYLESITEDMVIPEPLPFRYNDWDRPKNTREAYSLFCEWKKMFPGPYSVFEYHFWKHQYRDPGSMDFARRVYEDTVSHRFMETCGCMQDGSVKSFFPNGFAEYIYAETLINRELDYQKALEDYYTALYGDDRDTVLTYLTAITEAFSFAYMEGELSTKPQHGTHYNPEREAHFQKVPQLCRQMRDYIEKRSPEKRRTRGVAWQLLLRHTQYCEGLAAVMAEKCVGNDPIALEKLMAFLQDFGKYDYEIGRYFDISLMAYSHIPVIKQMPAIEQ
ncbi:MAG: DUF4838 domain-containing protein [Oscillospiraceae bacterium]|nr:DUF4838 domain-containing protein [Oscillospiraceae bacterium]